MKRLLAKSLRPASPSAVRRRRRDAFLQVESLEDRRLLAVGSSTLTAAALSKVPLSFEANVGQADRSADYLARGPGYALFLNSAEAVLSLTPDRPDAAESVLRMQLVGGNPLAPAAGRDLLDGKVNYLVGDDPSDWHTDISTFGRVEYRGVYPGVDVVYYGNGTRLEYDFLLAPGADPGAITLRFDGADRTSIAPDGDLVLDLAGGQVVQPAPVLYQTVAGVRRSVSGGYMLAADGTVRFTVGPHDSTLPLTIDPVLTYSTYLGGGVSDYGYGIAVDDAGSAYVTGAVGSSGFPRVKPFQSPPNNGTQYAFVTKFSPSGDWLLYSTYFGGTDGANHGHSIAVDDAGNAYIAGGTGATNFPTKGAFQQRYGENGDAFIVKVNSSGGLAYSSYYGGDDYETPMGVAVDDDGNAWVMGVIDVFNGDDLPTVNPTQPNFGGGSGDVFVFKVGPGGSLDFSTYLGGNDSESAEVYGHSIAVDSSGNAYVVGVTSSTNFPLLNAFRTTPDNSFLVKYGPNGTRTYATYYGGNGPVESISAVAADAAGNVYLAGYTDSTNLATSGAYQTTNRGAIDAYVTKINAAGTAVVYSTYLGGSIDDFAYDVTVDDAGSVYVAGETTSLETGPTRVLFPKVNAVQDYGFGLTDGFVAQFTTDGSGLVFSTPLGGHGNDPATGVAVDPSGGIYVVGFTQSRDFVTANAYDDTYGGATDTYVVKLTPTAGPQGVLQSSGATYSGGEGGGDVTVTVSRTGGSTGKVLVNYSTAGISAIDGADYDDTAGTLTLNNGVTSATFTVHLLDDPNVEKPETLRLFLSGAANGAVLGDVRTAVLTITDDDPKVGFQVNASNIGEVGGAAKVALTLSAKSNKPVTVTYTVTGGSATNGSDYRLVTTGKKTFLPGVTLLKLHVPVINDNLDESDETVQITLSNPVNAGLSAIVVHTLTIQDNDPVPDLRHSTAAVNIALSPARDVGARPQPLAVQASSARPSTSTTNESSDSSTPIRREKRGWLAVVWEWVSH